jgi:hypothetical protein
MDILAIKEFPTVLNNEHESLTRSYQTLQKVKEMLHREDSGATILDVIHAIESPDVDKQAAPAFKIVPPGSEYTSR